jgi:hypothetical protein
MSRQDRLGETPSDRRDAAPERRERTERTAAPPIEREHETYQGVFDEDEQREDEHP